MEPKSIMFAADSIRTIASYLVCGLGVLTGCIGRNVTEAPSGAVQTDDAPAASLVVAFPRGEVDLDVLAREEVRRLASRAGSGSALVMGFANDFDDFDTNLKMAERRARLVADELQARGIPRERIVVAASELARDDELCGRVEVVLVRQPRILVQSAGHSCVLPERIAGGWPWRWACGLARRL